MTCPPPLESICTALTSSPGIELGLAGLPIVALCWLFFAQRRTRFVHHATEAVHEICGQGVIVAHTGGHILRINTPARELLFPGQKANETPTLPEPIRLLLAEAEEQHHTLRVGKDRLIDISISPSNAKKRRAARHRGPGRHRGTQGPSSSPPARALRQPHGTRQPAPLHRPVGEGDSAGRGGRRQGRPVLISISIDSRR